MQASEYIQIACAIVGLALITWVRVSYTKRLQVDPTVNDYTPVERNTRRVAYGFLFVAIALVFVPF